MIPTFSSIATDPSLWVALCRHCSAQRVADPCGVELAPLVVAVISGCCHDCGAGFCLCRGQLACGRCPRKNARVIVDELLAWQILVPAAPETVPSPL